MSIYADKRNGKPTGRWQVEVHKAGKMLRARTDSFELAKEKEREFILKLTSELPQDNAPPSRYVSAQSRRLSDVIRQAEEHLWVGKVEAEENFKKLRFITKVLSDVPIDRVCTKEIDQLVAHLRTKGPKGRPLMDSTINRYLSTFSRFLHWAQDRGYKQTPMPKIEWLDEDEGRIRWLEADEEKKLIGLLADPFDTIVRVAIKTGMRKSEIYEVVSGEYGQLTPGMIHLWKTKNRTARSIPISAETFRDIKHLRNVGMPTERQIQYAWDKAKKAMGLENDDDFVFHACRHTCATRMVRAGVDVLTIKKMLGHKAIQTTMRYAHVSDDDLRDAVQKVAMLFPQQC